MASVCSHVIAVIIVNVFICSCGKAMPTNNISIVNSLDILAKTCVSPLLSTQIKQKLNECNVDIQIPYKGKQVECLLFYDINKQLCQAVKESNLAVNENDIAKLDTELKIEAVCASAQTWNVSNLEEYPHYKTALDKVLKEPYSCAFVCKEDDIEALGANYFCKYYNWGLQLLSNKPTLPAQDTGDTAVEVVDPKTNIIPMKQVPTLLVSTPSVSIANQANLSIPGKENKPSTSDKVETIPKVVNLPEKSSTVGRVISGAPQPIKELSGEADIKVGTDSKTVPLVPVEDTANNDASEVGEKPLTDEEKPPIGKDFDDKDIGTGAKGEDTIGDSFKNGPSYGEDEDVEDDIDGFEAKKPIQEKIKTKPAVESGLSFNGEIMSQKEMATNTFPEGYEEDSDNFFPVFLTGIIMVVLLYVLYHNKSKVSKVVLGLIVEGRQTNRRRNSRGHAYRRLDTLEQAMNTNSSAPPSKIIY